MTIFCVDEVFGELESTSHHQVIGEGGGGVMGEGGEAVEVEGGGDRFAATRSLLRGKVQTNSLEVREIVSYYWVEREVCLVVTL